MTAQYKIIGKIAENGSSVIVGRAADFVLSDRKDVVRVWRVMEVCGDAEQALSRPPVKRRLSL